MPAAPSSLRNVAIIAHVDHGKTTLVDQLFRQSGTLPPGSMIKLYFASEDLPFGLLPTKSSLDAYLDMIGDWDIPWSVSAFGDDCVACGLASEAIGRGGHVQVGLEPYGGDRKPSNVELVEEVVALATELGRDVATPEQAAAILGLPSFPVSYGKSAA